jgi:hypothetical protein
VNRTRSRPALPCPLRMILSPRRPLSLLRAGAAARSLFLKNPTLSQRLCVEPTRLFSLWGRRSGIGREAPGLESPCRPVSLDSTRSGAAGRAPRRSVESCGGWPTGPVLESTHRRVRFPGGLDSVDARPSRGLGQGRLSTGPGVESTRSRCGAYSFAWGLSRGAYSSVQIRKEG